jgi:dihydrofolate reductase
MATIAVLDHVTLDGVMQAPGRADEDRRDGFPFGGWEPPYGDDVMGEHLGAGMAGGGALLLGRRTFEDLAAYWGALGDDDPTAAHINPMAKFVASRTLTAPLEWNATLLQGDAGDAVEQLKRSFDGNLTVLGSGELVQTLLERSLIDRVTVLIHPLLFGIGRRLFPPGTAPTTLRLVEATPTTTGVIIAVYEPLATRRARP